MTKSTTRETADVANIAGRKNLIINGGFDVWQRGTSFTSANSFTADRWYINSGSATVAASQQSFLVGQTEVPYSPSYFLRMGIAGADTRQVLHKVEGISKFSGQAVTLSYWAKSNIAVTPDCRLFAIYNGSSDEVLNYIANVEIGTGWAKYTHTFNIKSFSGKTIGPDSCLQIDWTFFDDSNYEFDIANVQLEVGSIATDFEHRSYGEELALCQRYYQQFDYTGTYHHIGLGQAGGPFLCYMDFPFLNEMRTPPTISHNGVGNFRLNSFSTGQDEVCNNIIYDFITKYSARIRFYKATGDFTTNQNAYINTESDNNASFYIDAEL